MDIKRVKKRMKDEYGIISDMTDKEAYQFNRGFIWGTSFKSTKEERGGLYAFNESIIDKKEEK